ncbi:MAG TPA: FHA domain-containing protein [Burkholderiales bacterium]|nr:FHA domain-containing protein [Burkholderiales bacterium]
MAKLILSLEGSVIREIPINKERITIGRKAQNDIQIENLAVSSEHACIVTILADSFLEDMGSTNGTLVNGNSVKKHILQNNDVIEIGKYKMKYVIDATTASASAAPNEDFEKTMVMRAPKAVAAAPKPAAPAAPAPAAAAPVAAPKPAAAPPAPAALATPKPAAAPPAPAAPATSKPAAVPLAPAAPPTPKPTVPAAPAPAAAAPKPAAAPAAAHPLAALLLLTGGNAGKEIELTKNLTTLGKPGVQVAVITRRPMGYFLTHVEGATLPVVNGKALDNQARQLIDHDVIEMAGVKMEFFVKK